MVPHLDSCSLHLKSLPFCFPFEDACSKPASLLLFHFGDGSLLNFLLYTRRSFRIEFASHWAFMLLTVSMLYCRLREASHSSLQLLREVCFVELVLFNTDLPTAGRAYQ